MKFHIVKLYEIMLICIKSHKFMKFHIVKLYEIMLICIKSHKLMQNNQKTMIRTTVV